MVEVAIKLARAVKRRCLAKTLNTGGLEVQVGKGIRTTIVGVAIVGALLMGAQVATAKWHKKPTCESTYETFGQAYLNTWCVGCHTSHKNDFVRRQGAPADANFDTAEFLALKKAAILSMVADKKLMPPGFTRPTAEENEKLVAWLNCEFPDSDKK